MEADESNDENSCWGGVGGSCAKLSDGECEDALDDDAPPDTRAGLAAELAPSISMLKKSSRLAGNDDEEVESLSPAMLSTTMAGCEWGNMVVGVRWTVATKRLKIQRGRARSDPEPYRDNSLFWKNTQLPADRPQSCADKHLFLWFSLDADWLAFDESGRNAG